MNPKLASEAPTAPGRPHVHLLTDRCAGCQECVIRCPTGALQMDAARWVAVADDEVCVGCRQCVRSCPFSAVVVDGPTLVAPRVDPEPAHPGRLHGDLSEVRSGFSSWDEALIAAGRCLACPDPTCVRGCPAHNDIPAFIAAVRQRDLEGAHRILRATSVLPDVCARVCNQATQCEGACSWSLAGGVPVAIGYLERFVADRAPVPPPAPPQAGVDLSVGIIGAGPAGIGAAWELVEAGASVTVYEKDPTPGGLCGWGIPDFTLPEAIAARPWRQLEGAGIDLRCGTEVRPGDLDGLLVTHDAVIAAPGAALPLRLSVPGVELDGVTDATRFLQAAKTALQDGGDPGAFRAVFGLIGTDDPGRAASRVLVLGAGNTAMDVARSARRLGLEAVCVDWLDERFALTRPDELAEARNEGVEARFSRTLTRLEGEGGRVVRAELARTAQARADRPPEVVKGDPEVLSVDLVVMAMGYRVDPAVAAALPGTPVRRQPSGLPDRRWSASGLVANEAPAFADHNSVGILALGREAGLWAAALPVRARTWVVGDALVGPATVVEAMAQGRRAAAAILDARPARPGREPADGSARPPRVLVGYESEGGTTKRAAEAIAERFWRRGVDATVAALDEIGLPELAAADLLVVGTWVEGLVVTKVRPSRAARAWLAALPRLGGRPVALFCTYGVNPRGALAEMRAALEAKGAVVVDQAAFGPRERRREDDPAGPDAFGARLVAHALRQTSVRTVSR